MSTEINLDDDFVVFDDNITGKQIERKLRSEIPKEHQKTNDSRLMWLWSQRLAVIMNIKLKSKNVEDVMAATLVLSAAWTGYLPAIELLVQRLEGSAKSDQTIVEQDSMPV